MLLIIVQTHLLACSSNGISKKETDLNCDDYGCGPLSYPYEIIGEIGTEYYYNNYNNDDDHYIIIEKLFLNNSTLVCKVHANLCYGYKLKCDFKEYQQYYRSPAEYEQKSTQFIVGRFHEPNYSYDLYCNTRILDNNLEAIDCIPHDIDGIYSIEFDLSTVFWPNRLSFDVDYNQMEIDFILPLGEEDKYTNGYRIFMLPIDNQTIIEEIKKIIEY